MLEPILKMGNIVLAMQWLKVSGRQKITSLSARLQLSSSSNQSNYRDLPRLVTPRLASHSMGAASDHGVSSISGPWEEAHSETVGNYERRIDWLTSYGVVGYLYPWEACGKTTLMLDTPCSGVVLYQFQQRPSRPQQTPETFPLPWESGVNVTMWVCTL